MYASTVVQSRPTTTGDDGDLLTLEEELEPGCGHAESVSRLGNGDPFGFGRWGGQVRLWGLVGQRGGLEWPESVHQVEGLLATGSLFSRFTESLSLNPAACRCGPRALPTLPGTHALAHALDVQSP
jgi:hypothetical protein